MTERIALRAPAKINLLLTVGGRRDDGLHELVSVMQQVSLADTLEIAPADALTLDVVPEGAAPEDGTNLVARAAIALRTAHAVQAGAELTLTKAIPVGAGLGGGSADAAATLLGLKRVWDLPVSRKALEKLGASLGSDVPFCVRGGTATVTGTGSNVISLTVRTPLWWVLGISDTRLSTADVYAGFDRLGGGEVGEAHDVADALARGDLERLAAALRNDLEPAAFSLLPGLERGRTALTDAGAVGAVLSGSGPTWLGLARDERHATEIADRVAGSFSRTAVAVSL